MAYPIPSNETERLASLRAYGILDTPAEKEYDDLVALAAEICGTPLAAITLIDETRQWFKARVGIGDTETPRATAFCAHTICAADQEIFIVPDAQQDRRFADYANVTGDPRIRFYAGAPLVTRDGHALGALCVVDRQPRELTPEQLRALGILRRHVVNALELRRLVHEQERTIGELHAAQRALDSARREAEAATEAKSRFLATMSHEIRTPLNAMLGMTTLLRTTPLNPDQADSTETIRTSGEMLLTLVNDILDFSKIEAGRLDLEQTPFTVAACIDSACDLVAPVVREKKLRLQRHLDPAAPAVILGDEVRLRQILLNLLSNAVKFTPAGGEVTLGLTARPDAGGRLELEFAVRDTGIGIPADRIARLFQLYTQAETSTTRRYGGTGLGLAISKRLVEMMGGRMWVESSEGAGSTFRFTLLADPAEAATPRPIREKLDAGFAGRHPARVLVADDNPLNRKVALRLLENLGYRPAAVNDGEAALRHAGDPGCDFILMDDEMPGLTGPAATAEIRRQIPPEKQPVIVALTAHALVGDRERYLAAGMDEYLTKPLRVEHLTALLARLPALKAELQSRLRR
ncbi:MAG: response regulator [Opitutaceae bacterium]|nr:response regulator [Opitutaceae bacterium]